MSGASTAPLDPSLERLAHDLKNLMAVVVGFSELILRDLSADAIHREELLEIKKAGERAVTLAMRIVDKAHTLEAR